MTRRPTLREIAFYLVVPLAALAWLVALVADGT